MGRAALEAHIATARELMGARDAIERFLQWSVPELEANEVEDSDEGDE